MPIDPDKCDDVVKVHTVFQLACVFDAHPIASRVSTQTLRKEGAHIDMDQERSLVAVTTYVGVRVARVSLHSECR